MRPRSVKPRPPEVSTGPPGQVRACPISNFWFNFARFGFKIRFLTKFHNDFASLLPEKPQNHFILSKNFNIWRKIRKIPPKIPQKYPRQKQLAEFNEEEKDLLESISALKSAVTVLSKHNSLLQMPRSHIVGVAATVQNEMQKHASLLTLTHKQKRAMSS